MRRGKIVIEKVEKVKPTHQFFEVTIKKTITIFSCSSGVVDAITTVGSNPVKTFPVSLRSIFIEDTKTGEKFLTINDQHKYLFEKGEGTEVNFKTDIRTHALVFTKEQHILHSMRKTNTIATAYGNYVARQKAINKGAKDFLSWYSEEIAI